MSKTPFTVYYYIYDFIEIIESEQVTVEGLQTNGSIKASKITDLRKSELGGNQNRNSKNLNANFFNTGNKCKRPLGKENSLVPVQESKFRQNVIIKLDAYYIFNMVGVSVKQLRNCN